MTSPVISPHQAFLILAGGALASAAATWGYGVFARRRGIVDRPGKRRMHKGLIPRGSGIAFATVFVALVVLLHVSGHIPFRLFMVLGWGGFIVALIGFLDDLHSTSAVIRFFIQIAMAAFTLLMLGGLGPLRIGAASVDLGWWGHGLALVGLVWLVNVFNFMDGVDGVVASATIGILVVAAAILVVFSAAPALALPLGVLAAVLVGFLIFNWPPAKVFMGDAGSTFLGYAVGAFMMATMNAGLMSVWTWGILVATLFADATLTLVIRAFKSPTWYADVHRSHAYQNLARDWNSHRKVTLGVIAIQILWLTPLALLSVVAKAWAPLLLIIALAPLALIVLRYGPLHSFD